MTLSRINAGADTIIVGAGSAGAVIAARMTENDAHQVLLLEAGPDYDPDRELPGDLNDGTRNSLLSHDWSSTRSTKPSRWSRRLAASSRGSRAIA